MSDFINATAICERVRIESNPSDNSLLDFINMLGFAFRSAGVRVVYRHPFECSISGFTWFAGETFAFAWIIWLITIVFGFIIFAAYYRSAVNIGRMTALEELALVMDSEMNKHRPLDKHHPSTAHREYYGRPAEAEKEEAEIEVTRSTLEIHFREMLEFERIVNDAYKASFGYGFRFWKYVLLELPGITPYRRGWLKERKHYLEDREKGQKRVFDSCCGLKDEFEEEENEEGE